MELIYIWTDKFRGIENCEINFKNNIKLSVVEGVLSINENKDDFEGFYHDRIKSIKVLIGENGSGKSTILDLIKIVCCTNKESKLRISPDSFNALVVFRTKEGKYLFSRQGNISFIIDKKIKEIKNIENQILNNLGFVYYCHSLEYGERHRKDYNVFDISTYGEIISASSNFDEEFNSHNILGWENIFDQFQKDEIERQIKFICDKNIKLPFDLPNKINFSINEFESTYESHIDEDEYLEDKITKDDKHKEKPSDMSARIIRDFIKEFDYKPTGEYKTEEHFFCELLQLSIKNYIEFKSDMSRDGIYANPPSYKVEEDEIADIIRKINVQNKKDKFQSFFDSFPINTEIESYYYKGNELYNVIKELSSFFHEEGQLLNSKSGFIILDNPIVKGRFNEIIKKHFLFLFFPSLISFKWFDLSSGEINFLNLLARLYEIRRLEDASNLALMIDEGDLTLHPEWQRQYINFLVTNLPILFPNISYQIILTSHSPIILSDIPQHDIMYMKKEPPINIKTFGSNINELYAHSFVMEHLMGDFSKNKIELLLGELYQKKRTVFEGKSKIQIKQYNDFKMRIDIIGDDIIRNRLIEILDSIPKDIDLLDYELTLARQRVIELENQANQK